MIDNIKEIDITIEKNTIKTEQTNKINDTPQTNKNEEIKLTKT